MKRWVVYFLGLLLVGMAGLTPFRNTDIAKLQPVELLSIRMANGQIRLETDTGDFGLGATVGEALQNLKDTTAGDVFLETADHLLITKNGEHFIEQIADDLRPGCRLCIVEGAVDLKEAAAYLSAHKSEMSLLDWRSGENCLPILRVTEGRMELVQGTNTG